MLFTGDDRAEGHHQVVVQDDAGTTLARRRLPGGADGIARLHELLAVLAGGDGEPDPAQVVIVIETERGPWVRALAAAGYRVCAVNPKQAARHKEAVAVPGKKDDFFDAACRADMGRTRRHQIRELAPDSEIAEALKIAARAHQKLVWERTRHLLRMRSAPRGYVPAALEACADLTLSGPDAPELPGKAPDPASAAKLTAAQITAALRRARRRGDLAARARRIQAALRAPHPARPEIIAAAYAASARAAAAVITALNQQAMELEAVVSEVFHRHLDAAVCLSRPGIGVITGARILGESGDAPGRYASARARRNYEGTSPLTTESGKKKTVHARWIRDRYLAGALHARALSWLTASPAPAPTPTSRATATSATKTPCAALAAASPASCPAASRPAANTTRPLPAATAPSQGRTIRPHDPVTRATPARGPSGWHTRRTATSARPHAHHP